MAGVIDSEGRGLDGGRHIGFHDWICVSNMKNCCSWDASMCPYIAMSVLLDMGVDDVIGIVSWLNAS